MMDINNNIVHFITSNKVRKLSERKCFVTEVELKGREGGTHRWIPYGNGSLFMFSDMSGQLTVVEILDTPVVDAEDLHVPKRPKKLRHSERSIALYMCSSDDRLHILCSRVRCSTSENLWSSSLTPGWET
jgi:hypothetical protein